MALTSSDTIVAISTPPGRGGIGIVRLSGPRARAIAEPMLRLRHGLEHARARFGELLDTLTPPPPPEIVIQSERGPRQARSLGWEAEDLPSLNPNKTLSFRPHPELAEGGAEKPASSSAPDVGAHLTPLDQAVTTFYAAPNSYTGEDLVEIALHGSPVLLDHAVRQTLAAGARLAEPGEFTQRAFLAGRIDLTQAEAVHDLIASSTLEQARLAARQMGGSLAHAVAPIKEKLVALIATLEAGIDFAEDDIDVLPPESILDQIDATLSPLRALEQSFARGRILREGLRLAIVGRPNAGKSSLFNRLLERERAIVTAAPGTTRDTVSERVAIRGIPVELIDTAGLREATDEAERLGIARSREAMAEADLTLLVIDASARPTPEDETIIAEHLASGRPLLIALNKSDLIKNVSFRPGTLIDLQTDVSFQPDTQTNRPNENVSFQPDPELAAGEAEKPASGTATEPKGPPTIPTSATTGQGLDDLRTAIVEAAGAAPSAEPGTLTSLRQHTAVEAAIAGLESARAAVDASIPHEALILDLYEALRGLDALTGATTTDDILHLVFSTFCIGK